MKRDKYWQKVSAVITAAASTAAVFAVLCALWNCGCFLPWWVKWKSGSFCDSTGRYEVSLKHRKVTVRHGETQIWASPKGVKVQEALSCDIDNDQEEELVLLCWKVGRYGKHKPFWVEEDERKWSQHIFIYKYLNGELRPRWMSSYIGQDVADMEAGGPQSAAKAANRLFLTEPDGNISCWAWDFWGLAKVDADVSFAVFGDNLIHGPIYRHGLRSGSFDFLFENFTDVISESDIAVINQETPLVDDPALYSDYPRFGTPEGVGEAIVDAGFRVVTCGTNHALDKGAYGVAFTKSFFESNDVMCLGIQAEDEADYEPFRVLSQNGIRFALLNYTYGTNGIKIPDENPNMVHLLGDEARIREDIGRARDAADFVIVFVHWGTEDSSRTDDFQHKWTQAFLEEKADVVVGTHPHALQPYEVLTGEDGHEMLVYYSIGNFISAQPEKSCIKGGIARFTASLTPEGYKITEYTLQPLSIVWRGGTYTVESYK